MPLLHGELCNVGFTQKQFFRIKKMQRNFALRNTLSQETIACASVTETEWERSLSLQLFCVLMTRVQLYKHAHVKVYVLHGILLLSQKEKNKNTRCLSMFFRPPSSTFFFVCRLSAKTSGQRAFCPEWKLQKSRVCLETGERASFSLCASLLLYVCLFVCSVLHTIFCNKSMVYDLP